MRRLTFAVTLGLLCAALAACSDDTAGGPDTGTPKDAAGNKDTRPDTAPGVDTGATSDKGTTLPPDKGTTLLPDKGTTLLPDKGITPRPDQGSGPGCQPVCHNVGTKSEGWYDGCTKKLIAYDSCAKCTSLCKDCGTGCKSNGWYSSCTLAVILYDTCKECKPQCGAIGSKSEGWYDSCGGGILNMPGTSTPYWDTCKGCVAQCKSSGGVIAPGYYNSCDSKLLLAKACVP